MPICKLCEANFDNSKALKESHIIPRFMFVKSKGRNGRSIVYRESLDSLEVSQEDWKQPMLCENCEQKLSTKYEIYMNEILYLRRKTNDICTCDQRIVLEADADKMALSLITIFWRAAVSNMDEFRLTVAPDYVLEEMRQWIINESIVPNWDRLIGIKIVEVMAGPEDTLFSIVPPFFESKFDHFDFIFVCGGFMLTYTMPPTWSKGFSRMTSLCAGSPIVWIERENYRDIPVMNRLINAMKGASIPESIRKLQERDAIKSGGSRPKRFKREA